MSCFLTTQSYREEFPEVFATVSCDGNMTGTDVLRHDWFPSAIPAKLSDFKPSCVALPDRHQVHRLQVSVGTRCIRYVRDGVWLPNCPFFNSNLLNLISAPETVFDIEIQDLMVCASHFWFQIFYACSKLMKVTQGYLVSKH